MKPSIAVLSPSSALTKRLGGAYARLIASQSRHRAEIVFLQGDLGSGKTTFVKGFLKALGIVPRGASPTFVLMKHYPVSRRGSRIGHVYHYDAYRLSSVRDLDALGFFAASRDPRAVMLVEWPEKISSHAVRPTRRVRFAYGASPRQRLLSFS